MVNHEEEKKDSPADVPVTQLKLLSFYGKKEEIKIKELSQGHNTEHYQSNSPAKADSSSTHQRARAEARR